MECSRRMTALALADILYMMSKGLYLEYECQLIWLKICNMVAKAIDRLFVIVSNNLCVFAHRTALRYTMKPLDTAAET